MNKTEILNIVNEPTKHIQLVKIDGKDSIVYSAKFVELLELIPTMLTKADIVAMLDEMIAELEERKEKEYLCFDDDDMDIYTTGLNDAIGIIDKYKTESEE